MLNIVVSLVIIIWQWGGIQGLYTLNTLRPRQNGHIFSDDIFKCIFLNENAWIPIKISLTFVPHGPINNIPALVQIMAWRRLGDKPLSGSMMVRLPTHICVTRPQWIKMPYFDIFPSNLTVRKSNQNIIWINKCKVPRCKYAPIRPNLFKQRTLYMCKVTRCVPYKPNHTVQVCPRTLQMHLKQGL